MLLWPFRNSYRTGVSPSSWFKWSSDLNDWFLRPLAVCQLTLKRVTTVCVSVCVSYTSPSVLHPSLFRPLASMFSIPRSPSVASSNPVFFLNSSCSHKLLHFLSHPWELVPCHSLTSYESKYKLRICVCVCVLRYQFLRVKSSIPLSYLSWTDKSRSSRFLFFILRLAFDSRQLLQRLHVVSPEQTEQNRSRITQIRSFVYVRPLTPTVITTLD